MKKATLLTLLVAACSGFVVPALVACGGDNNAPPAATPTNASGSASPTATPGDAPKSGGGGW